MYSLYSFMYSFNFVSVVKIFEEAICVENQLSAKDPVLTLYFTLMDKNIKIGILQIKQVLSLMSRLGKIKKKCLRV